MSDYAKLRAGLDVVYGFFCGGDPRLFQPDEDSCTAEEIERWRAACVEWDRREAAGVAGLGQGEETDCVHGPGFTLTLSGFGIGTQYHVFEDGEDEGT